MLGALAGFGGIGDLEAQRVSIVDWRERYARRMLDLDFEPVPGAPIHISSEPIVDGIRMARSSFSAGFTRRDTSNDDDLFGFLISRSRHIEVAKRRCFSLGRGDAALLRTSDPGRLGSHERFQYVAVMVPFVELRARVADASSMVAERVPHGSEPLKLLRAYIRALEKSQLSTQSHDMIRRHIIDLVGLSVSSHRVLGETDLTAVATGRLNVALEYIAANFREPELSIESVARSQGISVRYVQRLLENSGTSFSAQVNELRLKMAFAQLTEPASAGRRISQIALHAGFSDISHFNRTFKGRYGASPSDVRVRARSKRPN